MSNDDPMKNGVRAATSLLLLLLINGGTLAAQSDSTTTRPSFRRILLGTAAGAVLGTAVIAGPPTWIAHEKDDGGTVSGAEIVFAVTAPIGWWLGQSAGASWGSGGRVRMRSLLLPAAVWTVAGVFVSSRMPGGWPAAVFPLAALAGTSWSAYSRARSAPSLDDPGLVLLPSYTAGRGVGISGSFRVGSSP